VVELEYCAGRKLSLGQHFNQRFNPTFKLPAASTNKQTKMIAPPCCTARRRPCQHFTAISPTKTQKKRQNCADGAHHVVQHAADLGPGRLQALQALQAAGGADEGGVGERSHAWKAACMGSRRCRQPRTLHASVFVGHRLRLRLPRYQTYPKPTETASVARSWSLSVGW